MNKYNKFFFGIVLLSFMQITQAIEVQKCSEDTPTNAEYVFGIKEYYKGAVRVFFVDTLGEPACCSTSMLVYLPKLNAETAGESECYWVVHNKQTGFMGIEFTQIQSDYNLKGELTLTFPYSLYSDLYGNDDEANRKSDTGRIIINLAEAKVQTL